MPCTLSFAPRSVPLCPGSHSRPWLQEGSACSDETFSFSEKSNPTTGFTRPGLMWTGFRRDKCFQSWTSRHPCRQPALSQNLPRSAATRSGRKSVEQLRRWAKISKEGPSHQSTPGASRQVSAERVRCPVYLNEGWCWSSTCLPASQFC